MKKQHGMKFAALCIAIVLIVCTFSVTAFAANISQNTGEITVSDVEESATVSAYQILKVNFDYTTQQPIEPTYVWSDQVAQWVIDNYGAYIDTADNSVKEDYTKADAGVLAQFYGKLAAAVKNGTVSIEAAGSCTGNGSISNLSMGGYLILIENGMKVYRPSVVNIVPEYSEATGWTMSAPTIQVKSSTLNIEKTVDQKKVAIGSLVSYELKADVPQYPADATSTGYAISDTLSQGLSFKADSLEVYGVGANDQETILDSSAYTKSTSRPTVAEQTTFSLNFKYDSIKQYKKIHISYKATVNENAVVGNTGIDNKAVLDYNNNPYVDGSWKEKSAETTVYTYGVKINKINKKNEELTGAEFTLSKKEDGSDAMYFIKTKDGEYRLADSSETGATQVLAVNANGKLTISGLNAEGVTLYLTETKAPAGYNKPSLPIQLEIKDEDINGKPTNGGSEEYEDGYVAIEVINTQGFQLPQTGGTGTMLFTAGGIALMGIAVILLFVMVKKRRLEKK